MIGRRYLAALALGFLLWCGLYLAFTGIIDPYGVSPLRVSWSRVNQFKPKRLDIDRLLKPFEVWRYQPRTVFLGTSRIHQSVDPAVLDGTRYAPAYNASIPASSLGLNVSHLRQYVGFDPQLRTVVMELFLYNFLGQAQERSPASLAEFMRNTGTLFFSGDALWASIQTLGYNLLRNAPHQAIGPGGNFNYPPGHNAKGPFGGYPAGIWKLHATRTEGMELHEPAFDAIREFSQICREQGVELVYVLTPNHAYDDYYLESVGAWRMVENWLRRVSAEATVYSFSQPNDWVYEPVTSSMRYWYDPYHFSAEMGRAMQLALTGAKVDDAPQNFMLRMTPDKAASHVASRREAIRRWAIRNPDFVAAFQKEKSKWESARTAAGK
ncbi:MAG: hypothetical protein HY661_23050 [Betaproteobacteria bacterium]|nr:hypothetical protein [Betaproteobacteria bacterium]